MSDDSLVLSDDADATGAFPDPLNSNATTSPINTLASQSGAYFRQPEPDGP